MNNNEEVRFSQKTDMKFSHGTKKYFYRSWYSYGHWHQRCLTKSIALKKSLLEGANTLWNTNTQVVHKQYFVTRSRLSSVRNTRYEYSRTVVSSDVEVPRPLIRWEKKCMRRGSYLRYTIIKGFMKKRNRWNRGTWSLTTISKLDHLLSLCMSTYISKG